MVEERNILDYLYVVAKWRKLIIASVLVVGLSAVGLALLLPEAWTANTTLLPPEEEAGPLGLSGLLNNPGGVNLGSLVGQSTPSEQLASYLDSRLLRGAIVDAFGLVEYYQAPHRARALDQLGQNMAHELGRDGTLHIEVSAPTADMAAKLCNAVAAQLDSLNRRFRRNRASQMRIFLERRLKDVRGELEDSAQKLRAFQEEHGLVDLEVQTGAAVEVMRSVVQELTLKAVQLKVVSGQFKDANDPNLKLMEMEVAALGRQLEQLAEDSSRSSATRALGPALQDLPQLGYQFNRLSLDVEIRKEIFQFLGTKLEEAKYKEALDTPTIQVLDQAVPPKARSAPKRSLIVLVAVAASLVLSVVLAFLLEALSQPTAHTEEKLKAIKALFHTK